MILRSHKEKSKIMNNEKRKELKENLKKKIDLMSDEELEQVSGGKGSAVKCPYCGVTVYTMGFKIDTCPVCQSKLS